MKKRIWNKKETIYLSTGVAFSSAAEMANFETKNPQGISRKPYAFAGIPNVEVVIETDDNNVLSEISLASIYKQRAESEGIDVQGKTYQQILEALEEKQKADADKMPEPSAEERIASAMEFQNLMSI